MKSNFSAKVKANRSDGGGQADLERIRESAAQIFLVHFTVDSCQYPNARHDDGNERNNPWIIRK